LEEEMANTVEIVKQYSFRSLIVVNGVEVGCIEGGKEVYVLLKKDMDKPFHWFNNAQAVARWKYGKGKAAGARAWAKKVLAALEVSEVIERLKTTSPLPLMESL
jgi:hypothetical protein